MDKKTAIAFGLIILVILLLPYYYKVVLPPQEPAPAPEQAAETIVSDSVRHQSGVTAEVPAEAELIPESIGVVQAAGGFTEEQDPELVFVETPLYQMTFSSRGGVLVGCRLLNYEGQDEGYVQLIRPEAEDNLNLILYQKGNPLDLRSVRFSADKRELFLAEHGEGVISLRAESAGGGWIRKTYTFRGDEYPLQLRVEAGGIPDLDPYYELYWGGGMEITETDTSQDLYYAKAYAYMGGELEKFSGKGDKNLSGQANGQTEWVAQRNKYFEVALMPVSSPGSGVIFGIDAVEAIGKHRPRIYRTAVRMSSRLDQEPASFTVFCGPLDQKIIKSVHPGLEETMNWGWAIIEPFSKAVIWSLKGLHKVIPNYGLVLIIFSILVKIIVWPLTHKSTKAASRMSAVQPKMKELQEKYKGQPEKLNKAVMQLYKEEGVNPLSSCWPTLLQMPLLYSLFIIFRSTIELRKEPFIFWIQDLSMPDTILNLPFSVPMYGAHIALLPIFMGVTQILMSKVMMTDPKQKAMMYFMPVFMVMIFNNFPSGLTLYYTLFNLWTYAQHMYLKRKGMLAAPAKPSRG
jgi:YidC/Oxa1 family membrane protein insertase